MEQMFSETVRSASFGYCNFESSSGTLSRIRFSARPSVGSMALKLSPHLLRWLLRNNNGLTVFEANLALGSHLFPWSYGSPPEMEHKPVKQRFWDTQNTC
jgi:hypothetical protein